MNASTIMAGFFRPRYAGSCNKVSKLILFNNKFVYERSLTFRRAPNVALYNPRGKLSKMLYEVNHPPIILSKKFTNKFFVTNKKNKKKFFFLFYFFVFCIESLQSKLTREKKWFFVGGVWRGVARDFAKKGVVPPSVFFLQKNAKKMHFSWKKGVFLRFFAEFLPKMTKKSWFLLIFFFSSGGYAIEKNALKEYRPRGKNPPIYTVLNAAFSAPCGAPWWTPPHSPAESPIFGPFPRPSGASSRRQNCPRNFPAKFFLWEKNFFIFSRWLLIVIFFY